VVKMKFQNVYEANIDFYETYKNICSKLPMVDRTSAGRKSQEGVGAITFRLYPSKIEVLIFPKGPPHKIQVAWTDEKEKEAYLPKLRNLLVPVNGQKEVIMTPLHMNIYQIPYPRPRNFRLAWCNYKVSYFAEGCDPWIWVLAPLSVGLGLVCLGLSIEAPRT